MPVGRDGEVTFPPPQAAVGETRWRRRTGAWLGQVELFAGPEEEEEEEDFPGRLNPAMSLVVKSRLRREGTVLLMELGKFGVN